MIWRREVLANPCAAIVARSSADQNGIRRWLSVLYRHARLDMSLADAVRFGVLARQIGATAEDILDLAGDVDPQRDHIRGPDDAPVTLVEYGDFECPYCGQAESVIRELLASFGDDVRYVWRHLPLNDVHGHAQLAAEAAEAAASQGKFWEMYDAMLAHQDELTPRQLGRIAAELGLDVDRFWDQLRGHEPDARRGFLG